MGQNMIYIINIERNLFLCTSIWGIWDLSGTFLRSVFETALFRIETSENVAVRDSSQNSGFVNSIYPVKMSLESVKS